MKKDKNQTLIKMLSLLTLLIIAAAVPAIADESRFLIAPTAQPTPPSQCTFFNEIASYDFTPLTNHDRDYKVVDPVSGQ